MSSATSRPSRTMLRRLVLSWLPFALACGDSEASGGGQGGAGTGTAGSTSNATSATSSSSSAATSTSSTGIVDPGCDRFTTDAECPGSPCYWAEGFSFDSALAVCQGGDPSMACSVGTPIGRCIYEDDDFFAQAFISIYREVGTSTEVVWFPQIPFDNDIPGWLMTCQDEPPCDGWPPLM